jgi:hypothetical protein
MVDGFHGIWENPAMAIFHAGKWWNDPKDRTHEELVELLGEPNYSREGQLDAAILERHHAGLPLPHHARRRLRQLLKGKA